MLVGCILITFSMWQITYSFDVDYYFSSPLRSKEVNCNSIRKMFCQIKCGTLSTLCIRDECYCLTVTSPDNINHRHSELHSPDPDMDFEDEEQTRPINKETEDVSFGSHPILRHHIAHFCPNLDLARQCIKKCIKIGKPAFCGKDHVCYCGHKYEHMEDDGKSDSNAKEIYSQFRDLYQKYFGISTGADNDEINSSK